jgi:competence ComEA-like helix-hairpin-helix protein
MIGSRSSRFDCHLSRGHLAALIVLCCLTAGALGLASRSRLWFRGDLPVDSVRVRDASENVDPNTASAASLQRLPNIGPTRARSIVQFRQDQGPSAYRNASDLRKVPDIGLGTARKIAPYLSVPNDLDG